jgi:DNA-binding NarL/FixJ family response regulator
MPKIKLLIADSRIIFSLGIASALEKTADIKVVSICASGKETISRAVKLKPDIVLLDSNILDFDCFEVTRQLKELLPETHIIVLNQRNLERQDPISLINMNVDGYVGEEIHPSNLINTIYDVATGKQAISPIMGLRMMKELRALQKKSEALTKINLTKREMEILSLVAKGLSNHEIAVQTYISSNTVKAHLSDIMKKLNVPNRQRAAILATEKGIIARPNPEP